MQKTRTKLQLKTSTIRILQDSQLAAVNGGRTNADAPTNNPTLCSGSNHCQKPTHPGQGQP
jgi:hypothetical protein